MVWLWESSSRTEVKIILFIIFSFGRTRKWIVRFPSDWQGEKKVKYDRSQPNKLEWPFDQKGWDLSYLFYEISSSPPPKKIIFQRQFSRRRQIVNFQVPGYWDALEFFEYIFLGFLIFKLFWTCSFSAREGVQPKVQAITSTCKAWNLPWSCR